MNFTNLKETNKTYLYHNGSYYTHYTLNMIFGITYKLFDSIIFTNRHTKDTLQTNITIDKRSNRIMSSVKPLINII